MEMKTLKIFVLVTFVAVVTGYGEDLGGLEDLEGLGADSNPYADYGGYGDASGTANMGFEKIDSILDLEKFINFAEMNEEPGGGVVGIFGIPEAEDQEDSNAEPNVIHDAEQFFAVIKDMSKRGFRFAVSNSDELRQKFKVKEGQFKVFVFLPPEFVNSAVDEKPKKRYPGIRIEKDSLKLFIQNNYFPSVGQLTFANEMTIYDLKRPVFGIFSRVNLDKDPKWVQYLANRIRKVIPASGKSKIQAVPPLFMLIDKIQSNQMFMFEIDLFKFNKEEVEKTDFVGVGCRDPVHRKYFRLDDEFSAENLESFVGFVEEYDIYRQAELLEASPLGITILDVDFEAQEEHILDADIEDDTKNPDETEDEDVDDSNVVEFSSSALSQTLDAIDSDIVVEFYAPWCGHCKRLKPIYAQVAEFLSESPILVSKMQADREMPPEGYNFDVGGFPTIFFVKKTSPREPIQYRGDLTFEGIVSFISKHRTDSAATQTSPDEL